MKPIKLLILPILAAFLINIGASEGIAQPVALTGVNLSVAEFGENNLPGTYGSDYTYPTHAEVDYFTGKGMNVFRLPFRWERLQRSANTAFDAAEQARIDDFVGYAASKGASIILDPHNYARYYGTIIGQGNVPASAFADFWTRLADRYKSNPKVIFGLMNEPHDMATELWRDDANAAIAAIRATGATNLILVPGNGYTGAHSWLQNYYGTPNGTVMLSISDAGNNFAFDVHQYLDGNFSGTSENCTGTTIGAEKLVAFTNWLHQNNRRGFLGEFGGGRNQTCYAAIDNMLNYVEANRDVWLGWTYWAAGPWWGEYIFTLEPTNCPNCVDRPQMAYLIPHFAAPTLVNVRRNFDFDGDGKADLAVFRPANGTWYVQQSFAGFAGAQFGIASDKIVPADYDGDGKTDYAVYRGGVWYLQRSTAGFVGIAFGTAEDIPLPADFDGDGKADLAVFRPSSGTWYVQGSTIGFYGVQFGQSGDKPVAADYDGDGKTDIAVYRSGVWYLNRSTAGFAGIQFGTSGDLTVPADYDGDGKTDLAVFRPSTGTWYLQRSTAGFSGVQFGQNGDAPAPADYDGDGKTDLAVYRAGTWYLNRSTTGFTGVSFGNSTDTAIPNAFVR